MIVNLPFDMGYLIIWKNPFCMIEIYFNSPSFIPIDKIAEPVIVLRNRKGLCKKLFILPSRMIHSFHVCKCERVTQGRLAHADIAVGVPFFIVSPGEI